MRRVAFEAMIGGWSIEEIAELRKVRPRTIRREIDRTLDERRLDAPDRYAHLQVARLTKELRVADAALDRGELRAIDSMVKVVRELDRYHGLRAFSRAAWPAPRAARLHPPTLRLNQSAPVACPPRESGGPETAAATLQMQRRGLDARVRGHDTENSVCPEARAAVDESDFVTGFGAQGLEIMGSLPESQPVSDGGDRPSRRAALCGAPQDEESSENRARGGGCFVTL
jgi:hypothetical protein